jgi:hypothetical protein
MKFVVKCSTGVFGITLAEAKKLGRRSYKIEYLIM